MSNGSSKQKVIQGIKDATNILVTVNADPSVDELSAALGLTIFLNKMGKHATAVFSGEIPPVLDFLRPDETFERTTDSLRDFIIALDKDKADHLRYKVVDDSVVKIFITPYRTTITEKDLEFSQGDYNVELVLALNVKSSDSIDAALTAHGKILHDAVVVAVTASDVKSELGSADWHIADASGVSEMAVELINDLKTSKVTMDEQIATALLTGIVSATDRFSNNVTSSRVMTTAAELMAAGANQQLVSSKIAEAEGEVKKDDDQGAPKTDNKDEQTSSAPKEAPEETKKEADDAVGTLSINHEKRGSLDEVARQTTEENQKASAQVAADKLAQLQPTPAPAPNIPAVDASASRVRREESAEIKGAKPSIGGTLNATTEQAEEDKRRESNNDQNKTILRHGEYIGSSEPSFGDPLLNAAMGKSDEPASVDPFKHGAAESTEALPGVGGASSLPPVAAPTPEPIPTPAPRDDNKAIMEALVSDTKQLAAEAAEAAAPAGMPTAPAAGMPPAVANVPTLADIEGGLAPNSLPPTPAMPPLPDFNTLPDLPPVPTGVDAANLPSIPVPGVNSAPAQPAAEFNPGQFQIPGQK